MLTARAHDTVWHHRYTIVLQRTHYLFHLVHIALDQFVLLGGTAVVMQMSWRSSQSRLRQTNSVRVSHLLLATSHLNTKTDTALHTLEATRVRLFGSLIYHHRLT